MIKNILFLFFTLFIVANASYEEGKKVFNKKCSSCHGGYIDFETLKENFFVQENRLLNLKYPTENMIAYAIMKGPKKIGDPNDPEMRQLEIEEYLKSYLDEPNRFFSICDNHALTYYGEKPSMKGQLSEEDYVNLSYFFMEYSNHIEKKKKQTVSINTNEKQILLKAKKNNKLIMIYATSKSCYYCKTMDKEVFAINEVQKEIEKNYILVKVDVGEASLPFDLIKKYKKITPSFFILNSDGEFIIQYPGSWSKSDFLEILKENINK